MREEQARRMGALAGRLAQVESGLGVRVAAERPVGAERSSAGRRNLVTPAVQENESLGGHDGAASR